MAVRFLTPDDAAEYRAVRIEALDERPAAFGSLAGDEPDERETATRLAKSDDHCFFGAFEAGRLVGILRASHYAAPNEKHRVYLAGFFVRTAFRRRGHGNGSLRAALDWSVADPIVRRINLNVVTGRCAAIRLYEHFGFVTCGIEREAFSCDGRYYDEQLMTLAVQPGERLHEAATQAGHWTVIPNSL